MTSSKLAVPIYVIKSVGTTGQIAILIFGLSQGSPNHQINTHTKFLIISLSDIL